MKLPLPLIFVYMTSFIDALGYSFVQPILPYYLEKIGGTASDLGLLTSIYAVTQAISAVAMGALSDMYGRRPYIILSLFGSFTGPLFQAFAPNLWVFFVARAYTGILGGSQTLCQAYIADTIPVEEVSTYIAYSSALIGVSFVMGPLVGGVFSQISPECPFYVCAGVSFIVFVLAILFITETNPRIVKQNKLKEEQKVLRKKVSLNEAEKKRFDEINDELEEIRIKAKTEKKPKLKWNKYIVFADIQRFLNDCSCCLFGSMYSQFLKDKVNSTQFDNSMIFVCTGLVLLLTQMLLFPWLHNKHHWSYSVFSFLGGVMLSIFITEVLKPLAIGWILMAYVQILWLQYITACVMYFGFSLLCPISPAMLSIHATPTTLGQSMSTGVFCGELAMIIIPLIAAGIYAFNQELCILSGALFGILTFLQVSIFSCMPGGKDLEKPSHPKLMKHVEEPKPELKTEIDVEAKQEDVKESEHNEEQPAPNDNMVITVEQHTSNPDSNASPLPTTTTEKNTPSPNVDTLPKEEPTVKTESN